MNLGQLITHVNTLSDEDFEPNIVVEFLNDAVAKVNAECDAEFPFFTITSSDVEYPGFSETWQRLLLVPYAVGRSKQKESSQFEYSDAYNQFYADLVEFKTRYPIPEQYKNQSASGVYDMDFSNSPYRW